MRCHHTFDMQIEKERIRIAKFKLWIILASKYARKKFVCQKEKKHVAIEVFNAVMCQKKFG